MIDSAAEFAIESWSAPEIPLRIEYRSEVMEDLRSAACDQLDPLERGGSGIAGVLFGVNFEQAIRILAWRPIPRAQGEQTNSRISPHDHAQIARLFGKAMSDPDLKGLSPVGWFASRASGGTGLEGMDVDILRTFFFRPWHAALILWPGAARSARAGFFARHADGSLKSDASYREFVLEPPPSPGRLPSKAAANVPNGGVPPETAPPASAEARAKTAPTATAPAEKPEPQKTAPPSARPAKARPKTPLPAVVEGAASAPDVTPNAASRQTTAQAKEIPPAATTPAPPHPAAEPRTEPAPSSAQPLAQAPADAPSFETPSFEIQGHSFGGSRWLWSIPVLLAMGLTAFLLKQKTSSTPVPSFSLRVGGAGNTVEITWDRDAAPIRHADHALVHIHDAADAPEITLNADQLHSGRTTYLRHSSDVGVEMTIYGLGDSEPREFAHLTVQESPASGATAARISTEASQSRAERDALEAQVAQLKEQLRQERSRGDRLQEVVRILENRLAVEGGRGRGPEAKQPR